MTAILLDEREVDQKETTQAIKKTKTLYLIVFPLHSSFFQYLIACLRNLADGATRNSAHPEYVQLFSTTASSRRTSKVQICNWFFRVSYGWETILTSFFLLLFKTFLILFFFNKMVVELFERFSSNKSPS
jgi:hypothetical protein